MGRTLRCGPPPARAEEAPFSYVRRRSGSKSARRVASVTSATNAADLSSTVAYAQPARTRRRGIFMSRTQNMMFAVHKQARRYSQAEVNAMQESISLASPSLSASLSSTTSVPPLTVDPVPSCLHPLSQGRSTRAWDAIAAGCIAEARRLSEADNDVVAKAASFILGGDPNQGLFLLESHVIATCVVLHEQQEGVLSSASCLKRHDTVLADWLQHRSQFRADRGLQLPHCDVNPMRVTEAVVRHVVLQSMQLMDTVEVHRWYAVALVLCTLHETHDGNSSDRRSSKLKDSSKSKAFMSNFYGNGHCCGWSSTAVPAGDGQYWSERQGSTEFTAVLSTRPGRDTPTQSAAAVPATGAVSESDGYRAPSNVWFRYFFALCETTSPDGLLANTPFTQSTPPSKTHSQGTPPTTPWGRAPTARSTSAAMDVNGGSWPTDPATRGRSGKLARTLSLFTGQHGGGITHGSSPSGDCQSRNSFCFSAPLSTQRAIPAWVTAALRPLDHEETTSLLLSHSTEWDVFFITAVTAFQTQHYRTCMMAASRFLHLVEAAGIMTQPIEASDHRANTRLSWLPTATHVLGLQEYQCRLALFVRAWSSLQVGERLQFGKDTVTLLDYAEDSLSYHVGCSLALFGLPLPAAKETVMTSTAYFTRPVAKVTPPAARADSAGSFSPAVQIYLYVLTESVHALTLLQLGMMEAAMGVAKTALDRTKALRMCGNSAVDSDRCDALLLSTLRHVVVIAATALEDSTSVLEVSLLPDLLAHIAVCPGFFGGFSAGGIRVKAQSEAHRLLYPSTLPLYASTRQMIPFHMNRAVYLYHAGQLRGAWDDACCAVAAVDEVVGSVEFAFSDCFPLQVYYFTCHVGFILLEALLSADLEAAKACLSNPVFQGAIDKKDATLQGDEVLSKEILHLCQDVVWRMLHFYPHSRLGELCQVQLAIMRGEKHFLSHAILLSDRYPHNPAAQNLLTLALYFDHHVPEAVDNAVRNLQTFPHSREVILVHRLLQRKYVVYRFDYRGILPTRYKPGLAGQVVTKRMAFLLLLLAANVGVLCLTVFVNTSSVERASERMKALAVRMQVPSPVPLIFAAVFIIHTIVATVTPHNLISTALTDLFFVNSALNRALFCLRCIPLVNLVNALLVSFAGNNFLFESASATFFLYFFLSLLFVPFTTRVWFLPSVDEPDVNMMSWLAILSVDAVMAFIVVVPHIILTMLEPYMFVVFYFYAPTPRPGYGADRLPPSSSMRRRLLLHAHYGQSMTSRFQVGSGSRFVYICCLKWLYYRTHSSMETRYLAESQLEAENYRVFPMIEGEEARVLFSHVPLTPMCTTLTSTELDLPSDSPPHRSVTGRGGGEVLDRDRDGQGITSLTPLSA
nr:unnamed protein product [Leishmania braziliensis]